MITFPKAKINLGLRVLSSRPDGYHDIETIFYPVPLTDALEFVTGTGTMAGDDELVTTGIKIDVGKEKNLVTRAVRKTREARDFPFLRIHLHKAIPAGAGLGGGSSDAAFMIKTLNRYFNLQLEERDMMAIAAELGSDCPFFINPCPSIAMGRGEILTPALPVLEGYYLVIANPGIHVDTREAYMNTLPVKGGTSLAELVALKPAGWKETVKNDFEEYVFKLHPVVGEMKKSLYSSGAVYSSMSGSGSSVYGIFDEKPDLPQELKRLVIFEGML